MYRSILILALFAALSWVGCTPEPVCAPGESQVCACGAGQGGTQSCQAEGATWAGCDCADGRAGDLSDVEPTDTEGRGPIPDSWASSDGLTDASPLTLEDGKDLYLVHCAGCHGVNATGELLGPDIRADVAQGSIETLMTVMVMGTADMPAIMVTADQAHAIALWLKNLYADYQPEP